MEKETNLEHYLPKVRRAIQEAYGNPVQIFNTIQKSIDPEIERNNPDCISDILAWMVQQYREPILDYAEKKYLSEVIRPFRKEVTGIVKEEDMIYCQDFITILVGDDYASLPRFAKGTMYKGLEYDKTYKPEELGL